MIGKSLLALAAFLILLPACEQQGWGTGETLGTVGGAAAGGLIGNQIGRGDGNTAATLTGILLGGFFGNRLGASVDESDRAAATSAEQRAYGAPMGQQITWSNPESGSQGGITPVRDGYGQSGSYCREFQQTITIDGRQTQGYGTACRQNDGSWKIVSEN